MTGSDVILQSLVTMEQTIIERVSDAHVADDLLQSMDVIKSCLRDIVSTNQFMIMSINRCIDYTKSTDGLKLKPTYDTVDLADVLRLPILCMQNSQEDCVISLGDIPPNLCSHVITDKHWLQENLLCLLSNAVKYSVGGEITVNVGLQQSSTSPREGLLNKKSLWSQDGLGNSGSTYIKSCSSNNFHGSFNSSPSSDTAAADYLNDSIDAVDVEDDMAFLRIEVQDKGIGIPEDKRNSLFHPFQQTQKLAGGTGLGLYSLAKRIDALGGTYGVKSRDDGERGSIFYFTIPYRPDQVAADSLTEEEMQDREDTHRDFVRLQLKDPDGMSSKSGSRRSSCASQISPPRKIKDGNSSSAACSPMSAARNSSKVLQQILVDLPKLNARPFGIAAPPIMTDNESSLAHSSEDNCSMSDCASSFNSDSGGLFMGANARMASSSAQNTPRTPTSVKGHILLVEDSQAIGKVTCALLSQCGYQVDWVVNGALALERLTKSVALSSNSDSFPFPRMDPSPIRSRYDAVLMDLQMPVMDGLEATRRLRSFEGSRSRSIDVNTDSNINDNHHQLVIGLSANSDKDTVKAAKSAGFDSFMEKPIKVEVLTALIARLSKPSIDADISTFSCKTTKY